jgi:hypothetical protein
VCLRLTINPINVTSTMKTIAVTRRKEQEQEAIERATITKHRALLARQAKAMVAEQAKPPKTARPHDVGESR